MRSAVVAFIIAFFIVIVFIGRMVSARSVSQVIVQQRQDSAVREIGKFHAVHVNGSMNVWIKRGPTTSLTLSGPPKLLPYLSSEVTDGVLAIGLKPHDFLETGDVTATLVTPDLDGVTLNGSGEVSVDGLHGPAFSAEINGSGSVHLKGRVDAAHFAIAGSGTINARELVAATVAVNDTGSGGASVNATRKLDVSIAGSGDVRYTGKPADIHQSVVGSGSVSSE